MSDLYRLVYASTAKNGMSREDLASILDSSVNNNNERYITGFLIFNGAGFMQVLEGPLEEVLEIYGRILRDDRHFGVVQTSGELGVDRAFPDWDMNYYRAELSDVVLRRDNTVAELLPPSVPLWLRELLIRFAEIR